MKKVLPLLLSLFFSCFVSAQQDVNTSISAQMNTVFGSLDMNKVPYSILLDYGMEFTNVPAYNGVLTDSTYSDKTILKQIYNTLLSSRVKAITPAWPTPTEYETTWSNNKTPGVITLSGLYFKYSQFADNAISANKITLSGNKFYDKVLNGVWQNPYQEMQTFAMAPAIRQYDNLTMEVKIPSNIFMTNNLNLVSSIQVDFDNGQGYVTVPFNQYISVTYTGNGTKNWRYKLNLTNGTSLYNQSRIKIGKDDVFPDFPLPVPPKHVCELCKTDATSGQTNITATIPYLGGLGTVKLTIDYAGDPSLGIRKPLIVAEGFDLGVLIEPEKPYGNFSYNDFRKLVANSGTDLRNLIYENNKQYDIIYVDWDNGVDYMQRNAYALEAVINYVNSIKTTTTKNVILGQSMGGVIARYALADMEQRGIDHKTSLFISHDAPQQGANIPVSLQYMFRHVTRLYAQVGNTTWGNVVTIPIAESSVGVSNYLSVLDAPASKQLIANFVNSNYDIDNSAYTSFYDELKSKGLTNSGGYPTQCRNIAISNGSECGSLQNFNPGDDLVKFTYNKGLNQLEDLLSLVALPLGASIGGELINRNLYGVAILGTFPGHSKFNVDFQAKSLYPTAGNQIYKGRISYTKKILWVLNVTVDITNVTKNQPAGILPFDTYSGGYYNTKIISGAIDPNLMIRDKFSFIPTASALDIGKRNVSLIDADYTRSYLASTPPVSPKNSPFANFTADFNKDDQNAHNKQHISFDSKNGRWLASELNAIINPTLIPEQSNCSYLCSGTATQITGGTVLCTSGVFSVPAGASTYNWSIIQGSNLVSVSGSTTPNLTLTKIGTSSGYVTMSVTFGDNGTACGILTLTKKIWVGKPSFDAQLTSTTNYVSIALVGINSDINQQGITSTTWTKTASTSNGNAGGSGFTGYGTGPNYYWTATLKITATNACGTTEITQTVTPAAPMPCDGINYGVTNDAKNMYSAKIIIDPCNGNGNSTINSEAASSKVANNDISSAELYDINGNFITSFKSNNFDLSQFKKGYYILSVFVKNKKIATKLLVN